MDKTGKVTTYINQRGDDKGMIPRWLPAGQTHQGMGEDIGENREHVTFGRIFGDNGRADVSTADSTKLHGFWAEEMLTCRQVRPLED